MPCFLVLCQHQAIWSISSRQCRQMGFVSSNSALSPKSTPWIVYFELARTECKPSWTAAGEDFELVLMEARHSLQPSRHR